MTRTKSSRALVSVVLAVLMAVAFMPAISYTSFAATAKKATKVTKVYHTGNKTYTRTVGSAWTLKYKLSPSKLTAAAKKVVWKSSNKSVVSVSAKSGNKAAVSFKKAGTATVTVYTKANKKAKATWKFKVVNAAKKVAATGVTVKANNSTDYTKTLTAGTILTATVAPADATGVTYQWYADGTAISGATSAQFTVTGDQIGKKITVKAKANTGAEVTSAESAKVENITVNDLRIYNTTEKSVATTANINSIGDNLEVQYKGADNAWAVYPADYATIQWYRTKTVTAANKATTTDTQAISGATAATYTVTKADAGYNLYAVVTPASSVKAVKKATDMTGVKSVKDGVYTLNESSVVAGVKNISDVNISVDDAVLTANKTVKSGTVLTAVTTPKSAADVVDYQWYKNGYKIDGATSATYTATDAGAYTVKISLKSGEGNYTIKDTATGTATSKFAAKVEAAKTEFSNVTVTNDTAANKNRTTNENGDKVYVNVSGVNPNYYTVKWYKVATNKYGESADAQITLAKLTGAYDKSANGYVGYTLSNLSNGDQIYAVVAGKTGTSYANYESKTNTLTITGSTAAGLSLTSSVQTNAGVTTIKSISIALQNPTAYKNATVEWEKASYNVVGSNNDRTFTSTGSKGTTYELNTTEASETFSIRAKITKADGTVEYSKIGHVVTATDGTQTFTPEAK